MLKNKKILPFALLLLIAIGNLMQGMERNLWFDEALTLLNFALLPDPGTIYQQYVIPNNQIVHTWILHLAAPFALAGGAPEFQLRVLPAAAAAALLAWLFFRFRARLGSWTLAVTLAAFAGSSAFMIYGTALRGYIWGALFVALALGAALDFARSGSKTALAGYFAAGLAAVGCAPTNLAGLAATVLYAMPLLPRRFWRAPRFWALALTPVAALALFYAPIGRQFLGCARLGEGWQNHAAAAGQFYGAAGLIFAVPLLAALFGLRKRGSWRDLIWLLPLAGFLLLPTAPFPRVFFPFLPIFALLLAERLRRAEAKFADSRLARNRFHKLLFLGTAAWLYVPPFLLQETAEMTDDYFRPYYIKKEFKPAALFQSPAIPWRSAPMIYASFDADPWAFLFQGALAGMETRNFVFDGPRGKVAALPDGALLILRHDESPDAFRERFGRQWHKIGQIGRNTVYQ